MLSVRHLFTVGLHCCLNIYFVGGSGGLGGGLGGQCRDRCGFFFSDKFGLADSSCR